MRRRIRRIFAGFNPLTRDTQDPSTSELQTQMRHDWDGRAVENARWYIASDVSSDAEFTESGKTDVEKYLAKINREWLQESRALEIGCGAGRMSAFLRLKVKSLVAIDVSPQMIEMARRRLDDDPRVELRVANGRDLSEFDERSFDFVFSYIVFQHVPKRIVESYVDEVRRVLDDEGRALLQFSGITDPRYIPPGDSDTFTMRSWTEDELRALFSGWHEFTIERSAVEPTIDHYWVTARP